MIETKNLSFGYDKNKSIIKNISFNIKKGDKVFFLGENGSGKSTLFLLLNGILKKNNGDIIVCGEKIKYDKKSLVELRKRIGIVFQDPEIQIFAPTVYQEVAYGLENICLKGVGLDERIEEALKIVGLFEYRERPCHQLSYGQKKRLTIASIIAMKPEILILDEPTTWLDMKNINILRNLIEEFKNKGHTILISTHDINFAYDMADYIYIMNKGKIVSEGSKEKVFNDKQLIKKYNLEFPLILEIERFCKIKGIEFEEFINYTKK